MTYKLRIAKMTLEERVMTKGDGDTRIRPAERCDAMAIAEIYNHVTGSVITFEEDAVTAAEIAQRIAEVRSASLPWFNR